VSTISKLTGKAEEDVKLVVNRLQSLLDVGSNGQVKVIRKSVRDYLTDPQRCSNLELQIDGRIIHANMTLNCLMWMNRLLKKNICDFDPFKVYTDIPDISVCIQRKIPDHLVYSCKYWVSHLTSSGIHEMGDDENRFKLLTSICNEKLLFWIEVMSIIGETTAA